MFNEDNKKPLCAFYHTKLQLFHIEKTVSSNLQYTTSFVNKKTQNQGYVGQNLRYLECRSSSLSDKED
jgi:hypothetical protein